MDCKHGNDRLECPNCQAIAFEDVTHDPDWDQYNHEPYVYGDGCRTPYDVDSLTDYGAEVENYWAQIGEDARS